MMKFFARFFHINSSKEFTCCINWIKFLSYKIDLNFLFFVCWCQNVTNHVIHDFGSIFCIFG